MKTLILTLMLMALPATARAELPAWAAPSNGEIVALAGVETLMAIDMLQTLKWSRRTQASPGDYGCEVNPLLGCRPSNAKIIGMVGGGMLLTAAIWYVLPPKARYIWTGVIGTAEIAAVSGNLFYAKVGFGF